jgi:hypothetical protein
MVEIRGSISLPDQSYDDLARHVCERSFDGHYCEGRNERDAGYRRTVMLVGDKKDCSNKIDPDLTIYANHIHWTSGDQKGTEK